MVKRRKVNISLSNKENEILESICYPRLPKSRFIAHALESCLSDENLIKKILQEKNKVDEKDKIKDLRDY